MKKIKKGGRKREKKRGRKKQERREEEMTRRNHEGILLKSQSRKGCPTYDTKPEDIKFKNG